MLRRFRISPLDLSSLACDLLINEGLSLPNFAPSGPQDQVSFLIDRDLFCSLEGKPDLRRTRSGRDDEVVLKLLLIPVVDQVHSRIYSGVLDLCILANVCPPLLRI